MKLHFANFIFVFVLGSVLFAQRHPQDCGSTAELKALTTTIGDLLPRWDVLPGKNGLVFVSRQAGKFHSQVSLSQNQTLNVNHPKIECNKVLASGNQTLQVFFAAGMAGLPELL
jgi:hypothetical protein